MPNIRWFTSINIWILWEHTYVVHRGQFECLWIKFCLHFFLSHVWYKCDKPTMRVFWTHSAYPVSHLYQFTFLRLVFVIYDSLIIQFILNWIFKEETPLLVFATVMGFKADDSACIKSSPIRVSTVPCLFCLHVAVMWWPKVVPSEAGSLLTIRWSFHQGGEILVCAWGTRYPTTPI